MWNLGTEPATCEGMLRDQYEQNRIMGTPKSRKLGLWLLAAGFLALGGVAVWMSPGGDAGVEQSTGPMRTETGSAGSVATSGARGDLARENSGPGLVTIHDLETITGINDGNELVGRRVDLHVPVQQHINDVAFWVGEQGNRLLVVLARDTRDGEARQRGEPSNSGISTVRGQQATISGTIERVPHPEAMYSWGLTNVDRRELMERRVYIRADSVQATGE